jgi:hypothetical protein
VAPTLFVPVFVPLELQPRAGGIQLKYALAIISGKL